MRTYPVFSVLDLLLFHRFTQIRIMCRSCYGKYIAFPKVASDASITCRSSLFIRSTDSGADITSGGHAPLVAVMKSTDAGQRNDLGRGRRSLRDGSAVRCILA